MAARPALRAGHGCGQAGAPLCRLEGCRAPHINAAVRIAEQNLPGFEVRVMGISAKQAAALIEQLAVLVVDDNAFMRKLVRGMLLSIGVKAVFEASDGIEA